jgi:hypothetical protein
MAAGFAAVIAGAILAAAVAKPAPPRQAPAPPTPREAFDRARTAFGRAEYGRAIELLHPLLYPEVLLDSEGESVQAHRMLGVSYLFENRPEEARREFRKLLELRPDYRFDPFLDPQRVVDFFNEVVKQEESAIAAIEARRRQREQEAIARRVREAARLAQASGPPVVYERRSYAINFVPFGAGQFQNGQRKKGWMFLGVEAGLAAVSVGAFVTNFALYGVEPHRGCLVAQPIDSSGTPIPCPPGQIDHSAEQTSTWLLRTQLVSGGLFFAVAAWGVVDAIRHYQRDVVVPSGPGELNLRASASRSSFRLTASPFGAGAVWEF